jgi:hypothetical protein
MRVGSKAMPSPMLQLSRSALEVKSPFLLGDESPEDAIRKYGNRVFNALNSPYARSVLKECAALGVAKPIVEKAMCCMVARIALIPRLIERMQEERPGNERALIELRRIVAILRIADRNAGQITEVLVFDDPRKPFAGWEIGLTPYIDHFEAAPAAEQLLRQGLGLPPHRIHELKATGRRSAVGYFSFMLHKHFTDGAPHDALVAKLLNATEFSSDTDTDAVRHYPDAYVKRQGAIGQ